MWCGESVVSVTGRRKRPSVSTLPGCLSPRSLHDSGSPRMGWTRRSSGQALYFETGTGARTEGSGDAVSVTVIRALLPGERSGPRKRIERTRSRYVHEVAFTEAGASVLFMRARPYFLALRGCSWGWNRVHLHSATFRWMNHGVKTYCQGIAMV